MIANKVQKALVVTCSRRWGRTRSRFAAHCDGDAGPGDMDPGNNWTQPQIVRSWPTTLPTCRWHPQTQAGCGVFVLSVGGPPRPARDQPDGQRRPGSLSPRPCLDPQLPPTSRRSSPRSARVGHAGTSSWTGCGTECCSRPPTPAAPGPARCAARTSRTSTCARTTSPPASTARDQAESAPGRTRKNPHGHLYAKTVSWSRSHPGVRMPRSA